MFDVCWADPNRELRSEKVARKETEIKQKEKRQSNNGRQSFSTTSSSSSDRAGHHFGFFSSIRGRRITAPSKPRQSALQQKSFTGQSSEHEPDRLHSTYGVRAILSHLDTSEVTVKQDETPSEPALRSPDHSEAVSSLWSRSHAVSPHTSFVESEAKGTPPSSPPQKWPDTPVTLFPPDQCERSSFMTGEQVVQLLGSNSFITKRTEVTVSPRPLDADIDDLLSEIQISAEQRKSSTPPSSDIPEESTIPVLDQSELFTQLSQSPQTPPPSEVCNNVIVYAEQQNPSKGHSSDLEAWKPPHEWCYSPTKEITSPTFDRAPGTPTSTEHDHIMAPDINALQREVRMMQAAGPDLMLANIKASMGGTSEAMVYKEFETSRKRWMFSALHRYGGFIDLERNGKLLGHINGTQPTKILALYETQASTSFLAALHPHLAFSHLSTKPISPRLFPNVQPIFVPTISASASARSLPHQRYAAVTCFNMPSLFPSTEIPPFLRYINRCLIPGGALHLTLIDPQPMSTSTGPRLRKWLFDNLLINLEQMFRTTYPSGTFPAWLAVGRLRGTGSSIATVRVPAVPDLIRYGAKSEIAATKDELRCLTARMLWQEVWGGFVKADRWWWDDETIVQECIEFGTQWEYSHIVAVKESR